jgi:chemotaxis protein MotB
MKKIAYGLTMLVAPVLLFSCSAGKKLEKANAEILNLQAANVQLKQQVTGYESELTKLKQENTQYIKEAQDCNELKEAIQRNLQALNKAMAEQGTSLRQIREKTESALNKFGAAGVDVTYKNGLVFISMNDKLLFNSGSAVLSPQGKEALGVVAEVLNENPKLKVIVVGNTDDVLVRSGFIDNWSLSTERANAIVRILRDDYSVDPSRLTAAGQGKYNPVADNATPEGKAQNRRTDIILNPDLSKLWEITEKQ